MRSLILGGLFLTTALTLPFGADARDAMVTRQIALPGPIAAERPQLPLEAPNILVVMTDDVGFGAVSAFGGPIPTPNLDAVAKRGLRYNRFHTTAMCSPTRASLLTGRNPHRVNMGAIVNLAVNAPGYTGVLPDSAATVGRVLRDAGYSTAWFGKDHVTPEWETTPAGPFTRWPNGLGFEYFYGFLNGATDQWSPSLYENGVSRDRPDQSGYILDRDLTDHLCDWVRQQASVAPDQRFFAYFAPGTAHEPHQAPRDWIEKFRGRFDAGWDALREETFRTQKAQGIIPADAVLTPRPKELPAWDALSAEQKIIASRLMEVHAAQRAYFDHEFGRVIDTLKQTGQYENTLIIFIEGDNGASAEAGPDGSIIGTLNHPRLPLDYQLGKLNDLGGPKSAENYPAGWAWAMDTPFQYFKQVASHLGGMRNGMVISWPARIDGHGEIRSQFSFVTDIAPTIYDAAGIVPPDVVDGVKQMPLDGVSLSYSFADPEAPTRHTSQYFEMLGNRGFYKDGWLANTVPGKLSFEAKDAPRPSRWVWQLYNLHKDYTQSRDLAAEYPAKLNELKAGFEAASRENGFSVLDLTLAERVPEYLRPYRKNGHEHFVFYASSHAYQDEAFPDIRNKSWKMLAKVTVGQNVQGTVVAQGGFPFGWGLYMFDGRPTFLYRIEPYPLARLAAPSALTPGDHEILVRVTADSAKPGAGATFALSIDGKEVGSMHLEATTPAFFGQEGVGVGRDVGTLISDDYTLPFVFDGKLESLHIDLGS